jgi:hypothetical protein
LSLILKYYQNKGPIVEVEKILKEDSESSEDEDEGEGEIEFNNDNNYNNNDYITLDQIKRVNLDTTTLICIVSELSNNHEDRDFEFKEEYLKKQTEDEKKNPVLPILTQFMNGKDLFVCQTAYDAFKNIINTIGGPNEKQRAESFLKNKVQLVPDSVDNDNEMVTSKLTLTNNLKEKAKTIFTTGQAMKAVTMTSNKSFVKSASFQVWLRLD